MTKQDNNIRSKIKYSIIRKLHLKLKKSENYNIKHAQNIP